MEIVYSSDFNNKFKDGVINCFYGDIVDLNNLGISIEGIEYDDEKKVKKLLGKSSRVDSILKYIELDKSILDKRICDLSKCDFKYMLLAYALINNYKYIIFDYFDYGITYKEKKKLIKIIRQMNKDGYNMIIVSKNLVFLSNLSHDISLVIDDNVLLVGDSIDIVLDNQRMFELPDIIKFINIANKKGANLEYTFDSKELLKDIYRGVK